MCPEGRRTMQKYLLGGCSRATTASEQYYCRACGCFFVYVIDTGSAGSRGKDGEGLIDKRLKGIERF